ncbi:MAG: hypothetical protein H6604_06270 [Flavobacteriales bacterium]|nr:hypothetical protein [Flavobacteriales bacterium]
MNHIQEDAFITWRVAQNILDYGVIGFNGMEKTSASTTHLYVFVSAIFNLLFGKEHFIYPILIFNTFLFTVGSVLLGKLFFSDFKRVALFTVFVGILPPSLKIGYLGMEYGILFFLYSLLLYYGFYKKQTWSYVVIPILLLWTRLDSAIFLGILFIFDAFYYKRGNFYMMFGGIIGIVSVLSFNYLYFGEIINQTITAKKYAYHSNASIVDKLYTSIARLDHFWGIVKVPEQYPNLSTYFFLVLEIVLLLYGIIKYKGFKRIFLVFIFTFSIVKMSIFISQQSFFDWYYWIPQILSFSVILYIILDANNPIKSAIIYSFFAIPVFMYQLVHSTATGNGEWNYRREIGLYLDKIEPDKSQKIFLEPAGYVPYFSKLKTVDQVGLVDRKHLNQIIKDRTCSDCNTFVEQKPKYILSLDKLNEIEHYKSCKNYNVVNNYKLIKSFRINDKINSDNKILDFIYHLKPSGRDYYLYQIKN